MKKVSFFDFTIKNSKEHQIAINNLYPGQSLDLRIEVKSNGYEDLFIYSNFGCVGELFSEDGNDVIPYVKDSGKYYIETKVKKFYKKNSNLSFVVIITVFEKEENFIEPIYPFLGDYYTDSDKYVFGAVMEEDFPKKYTVSNVNNFINVLKNLDDYDSCKLVRNGDIVDVYSELGDKFGNLSKQTSSLIIKYLENPDTFFTADIHSIKENDEGKWSCRIEIDLYIKKTLKVESGSKQKSDEFIDNLNLPKNEGLTGAERKLQKEIEKKKEQEGCMKFLVIVVILLAIYFIFIK